MELELASFPDALASRLSGLTALDLSRNQFERLPLSIAAITCLKALDMSEIFLQLLESDVFLLTSFTGIQRLAVLSQRTRESSGSGLSQDSLNHLRAFLGGSPGVELL